MLQVAIVLFLIGSALCGQSQSMTELIAFRALQGLGGGGLMVTTMAAIGDIIPPRERGRYQGFFGAVFGVATVIGPLLGGFFVDNLTWRWIFYVNLPLGLIALAVIAVAFQPRTEHVHHRIDYLGAAVLTAGLSAIVLFTSLGGTSYSWGSPFMIALIVIGVAMLILFPFVEHRASRADPAATPCSATASSSSRARSGSSSASPCSERSPSFRSTYRWSRATAQRSQGS